MDIAIEGARLTYFFIAILSLLVFAYLFGNLFSRWGMPKVVGEIVGGALLGPSCLGHFFPSAYRTVFSNQGELLAAVHWLGLVLLMFCSGFETEREIDRKEWFTIAGLVVGTTVLPALLGWVLPHFLDLDRVIGAAGNLLSLKLVIIVALAVTSIPVLARIFLDLGILQTEFAKIVLATATIHDLILWVLVSIATGLVSDRALTVRQMSAHTAVSIAFFAAALLFLPKMVRRAEASRLRLLAKNNESAVIVLVLLVFSVVASLLKINLVFGAFLAGIAVNCVKHPGIDAAKKHVKSFSLAFFIPVYFSVVGLKLDLIRNLDPSLCLGFILFAMAAQGLSSVVTARMLGFNWLSSTHLAMALNDRGGPCIVLASLALDLKIISPYFYVVLILLAIITSLAAGIWFRWTLRRHGPPALEKRVAGARQTVGDCR